MCSPGDSPSRTRPAPAVDPQNKRPGPCPRCVVSAGTVVFEPLRGGTWKGPCICPRVGSLGQEGSSVTPECLGLPCARTVPGDPNTPIISPAVHPSHPRPPHWVSARALIGGGLVTSYFIGCLSPRGGIGGGRGIQGSSPLVSEASWLLPSRPGEVSSVPLTQLSTPPVARTSEDSCPVSPRGRQPHRDLLGVPRCVHQSQVREAQEGLRGNARRVQLVVPGQRGRERRCPSWGPLPGPQRPWRPPEVEQAQAGRAQEGVGTHMPDAVGLQVQLLQGLRQVGGHEGQRVVAEVQDLCGVGGKQQREGRT